MTKTSKLLVSLFLPFVAGAVGSLFTSPAIEGWYSGLAKPAFNPPNWVFAPAWTVLYLLMGIALFLVWRKGWEKRNVRAAMVVFFLQLALNSLWSVIFFGSKNPGYAFLIIVALWVLIALTIFLFHRISKASAYLLLPYILWVSFAAYLNYAIWILNR